MVGSSTGLSLLRLHDACKRLLLSGLSWNSLLGEAAAFWLFDLFLLIQVDIQSQSLVVVLIS